MRQDDFILFQKQIKKYLNTGNYDTNLDVIKSLYKNLQERYRCEYIYKNNLFLKLISEYGLRVTSVLNELKIGSSKADLVLLNGSVRVYEIKTELDDFSKLSKQINDYQKFADEVSVVTDENSAKKLEIEYADSSIGIIILDAKHKIQIIKEAESNTSYFNFDTIFKILRKQEYIDLVTENFGFVPDVPNTQIFRTCYNLLADINIVDFQKQVLNKLKERKLSKPSLLRSSKTPRELKYICNSLDFNEQEYYKLYDFLKNKSVCTYHI
ncbi:sce7726 family protein [Bergeyella cardium]|uniref:MmcB family DNA repair protein n=1 Tax=Bergeyella cardium TaxID=1585976 RepID=A0A6P1QSC0_9FLAO|nr:sce7726 family protein [Bergeyella cardium]QHN65002.1 MmcB family DNA repair protein [Bergeyella cardium]WHE34316.1 sce7726 family protein [Bergeyella cardium]WHF60967.1 sce7726 family protein [Bergeyella cardium]